MKQYALALVTGATSGIGESLCQLLAFQKIDLIITGRNSERLNNLKAQLEKDVNVIAIATDLAEQRAPIIQLIKEYTPDLIINNAGFGLYGEAIELSVDKQLEMIELNISALTEITIEAAKQLALKKRKGTICNIASAAGFQIGPLFSIYASTKAYVIRFSESLDYELRNKEIRVLASCPGMVETHFAERAGAKTEYNTPFMTMRPEFAAQEIWKQIERGESVHIFNWKYRVMRMLSACLPRAWVARAVSRRIHSRL